MLRICGIVHCFSGSAGSAGPCGQYYRPSRGRPAVTAVTGRDGDNLIAWCAIYVMACPPLRPSELTGFSVT